MNTTPPSLEASTGQSLRTYLVQVPCVKDGETKKREGMTRLTSPSDRTMVKAFPFQLVFLFYTCCRNSYVWRLHYFRQL